MKTFLLTFLGLCIVLMGCGEYRCSEATSQIAFVSFTGSETDTIIVKKYGKSSNFTVLIDSFLLSRTNSSYEWSNDTLLVGNLYGTDNGLSPKYDYKVELIKANRQFLLTEITEEYRTIKRGISMDKVGCDNFITSYKVNGNLFSGYPNYYILYFRN